MATFIQLFTLSHIRYEGYHCCLNCVENTMLPTTPNWNDLRIFWKCIGQEACLLHLVN